MIAILVAKLRYIVTTTRRPPRKIERGFSTTCPVEVQRTRRTEWSAAAGRAPFHAEREGKRKHARPEARRSASVPDRKRVVVGKRVAVSVELGGRGIIHKKEQE